MAIVRNTVIPVTPVTTNEVVSPSPVGATTTGSNPVISTDDTVPEVDEATLAAFEEATTQSYEAFSDVVTVGTIVATPAIDTRFPADSPITIAGHVIQYDTSANMLLVAQSGQLYRIDVSQLQRVIMANAPAAVSSLTTDDIVEVVARKNEQQVLVAESLTITGRLDVVEFPF